MEEFQEEFPDFAVEYMQFQQTLNVCLNNFQENGSLVQNLKAPVQRSKL